MDRIVIAEDDETLLQALRDVLRRAGYEVAAAPDAEGAWRAAEEDWPDLVLTDLRLPDHDGLWLLQRVKGRNPATAVLLLTAYGTVETAVEAMKSGAFDFLTKPVRMEHLLHKVQQALEFSRQRRLLEEASQQRELLAAELEERLFFGEIVGGSPVMRRIYETVRKVAPTGSSVLISGESGTGKELVARAIHRLSPRREKPFVRVNCSALPEGVLESELFGHEKGAFTGAVRMRRGRFELAHGGTIFLDEVGEIPPSIQVKLLQVLQEKEFERVGGEETIRVDVRVIAATNKDLQAEVREGRFREDLFYRLYVVPIHLPPLRERRDDIPALCAHFLERLGRELGKKNLRIDPEALNLLLLYEWPGNVRELENVLERAAVLCEGDEIRAGDLPFASAEPRGRIPLPAGIPPLREAVEELERHLITKALEKAGGVKEEAARLLDLKPSTLYYKLDKYGLTSPSGESEATE
jgi:two-component system response regulator HydG